MNSSNPYRFSSIIVIAALILSACALPGMAPAAPVVYVDEDAAEAPSNHTYSKDPTESPTEAAEISSRDESGTPRLTQDVLCLSGPGQDWLVQSSLSQGIEVQLVGVGLQPGWLVISHPDYPEVRCWVPDDHIDLPDPDILTDLPILPVPPKP